MKRSQIPPALEVLCVVVLMLGLSLFGSVPAALAQEEEPEEDLGAALDYFLLKRSPDRVSPIPVEKYTDAFDHMKQMPQHATSTGQRLAPMAADPQAAAAAAILEGWTPLGPGNIGGRTRALIIDPVDPQTMYAAGVDGGVWKTTNGGASWRAVSDALPNIAVGSLAMDPTNRNVIYAGTGEAFAGGMGVTGGGIFKTTDAGITWTRLPGTTTSDFFIVPRLVISPNNPARLYAATGSGVWRSTDAGGSWQRMLFVSGGCGEIVIRSDMPSDYIFSACGIQPNSTVWRAKAAELLPGSGWEPVLNEPEMARTTLAIAPSDQRIVYALSAEAAGVYGNAVHAVFRSSASGDAGSWVAQVRQTPESDPMGRVILTDLSALIFPGCTMRDPSSWRSQGFYDNAITVDPLDPNIVWAGGIELFRSSDGGRTWGAAAALHADQHLIVFHPAYDGAANQTMFVTNDGGIYRTQNARGSVGTCANRQGDAIAWTSLNHGYEVTQFYHGLPYPDGTRYFGGTQDNGTVRGGDSTGIDGWEFLAGGDGGWVAVDPRNTNVIYVSTQGGMLLRSEDGGRSYVYDKRVTNQLFLAPLVMDPSAPDRLWTAGTQMYRTSDGGFNWTTASAPTPDTDVIMSIAVSPTDPNRVVAGTGSGKVLRTASALTSDGATVWAASTVNTRGFISGVTFDPVDPSIVYATSSTFGTQHVFRSTDGGVTWVSIDGSGTTGLPDIPVHVLLVDPIDRARLYIGTDAGVFVSTDGGATWAVEITGFAAVSTTALSMTTMNGVPTIFAFTFGRGAWRVAAGTPVPGPRITALAPSSTSAGGPAFTLTVTGSGFVSGAAVTWNGASRPTTFVSTTQLTASITAGDIAAAGSVPVTVRNPDGRVSNAVTFTITAGACPAGGFLAQYFANVTLSGTPARIACETAINYDWGAGGPTGLPVDNFSARWTGTFQFTGGTATFTARADDGIRVFVDGTILIDQFHDQPATTYTASRTLTAGPHEVKVEYYERGGDAVAQVSWTNGTPAPAITLLTPNQAPAGGSAFTLTVDGTGFASGASVLWNSAARTTTFVSATRLTAAIAASDIAGAGPVPVTVRNADGQTSNAQTFTVSSPSVCSTGQFAAQYFPNTTLTPPATRSLCENVINNEWGAGGPPGLPVDNFSARWIGVFQFAAGSVTFTARADDGIRVFLDGVAIIDQFHDQPATTYTATTTVSAGQHEVKVEYYERGGDAVAQVSWTGTTPAPTLTALTPSTAAAGGPAFTLTADGANFVSGAVLLWNGAQRTTTFVSATRLTADIPASDVFAAGTASVIVRNPNGQPSNALTFTITATGSCPTGQFFAEYFSNIALTPPVTRTACETAINNDYGAGSPAGLPVDNFSVRWTGRFTFAAGTFTFTARADDGVRVFIDGVVIIDQFHDQPPTTYTASRTLTAGEHEVKVEYYERGGGAVIQVSWTGGGTTPTLTSLTPSSGTAGGPAFTLTADGAGFMSGATVLWNGAARPTTFVTAARLTAAIPASDVAVAGTASVTVRNPDGQTSGPQTFTISQSGGDTIKVIITAPAGGATVRGSVWFTVWIENAAAGAKVYTLTVNGATVTSTSTTSNGPVSLAWPTTAADNGSRTATVSVGDSAGATGRASITLTVAN